MQSAQEVIRVTQEEGRQVTQKEIIRLPQEEVIRIAQKELSSNRELFRIFQHPRACKVYTEYLKKNAPNLQFVFVHSNFPLPCGLRFDGRFIYETPPKGSFPIYSPKDEILTASSVKNKFYLDPNKKGSLIEISSGQVWKFRCTKPYTSKELFDLRFDREKLDTDFKEWLYYRICDIYEKADIDDPRIDPLDGKREDLWHEALTLFRVHNQRAKPVNKLPDLSYEWISFDTLKNNINKIMSAYD